MRLVFSVVFLLVASFLFAQSSSHATTTENIDSILCPQGYDAIGHSYPPFRITSKNTIIDNQSLKGKVVLINFWFEGCHPGMAEMEALNELFKKMKSNKDFVFISLTWDNESIKRVKEKFGLAFEVFYISSKECKRLNFGCGYPTSIILNKSGVVSYWHSAGPIKKEEADEFIKTILLFEIESELKYR